MNQKIVEGFRGTPNCTGRSVIDDPIVDSGLYRNIGYIRFFKSKFDLKNQFFND
jgi:hypothetical protein